MRRFLRRHWLLCSITGVVGLLVGGFVLTLVLYPQIGAWVIRNRVVPKLEARFDRDVTIRAIHVTRGSAVLEGISVAGPSDSDRAPLVTIAKVEVTFDFWPTLRGDLRVHTVEVSGIRGLAVRRADGTDNFSDLLDTLRSKGSGGGGGRAGPSLRPDRLTVTDASFALHDAYADVTLAVGDLQLTADRELAEVQLDDIDVRTGFGPAAAVSSVVLSSELSDPARSASVTVVDGRAELWPGMTLTAINGTIAPGETQGQLAVDLSGSYGGADERLWTAVGELDPIAETGSLALAADRLTLDRIRSVLEGSALVDFETTSLDVDVKIEVADNSADIRGSLAVSDVNVFHPMLAEKPVRDIDVTGSFEAGLDRRSRTLTVTRADLRSRDVDFQLTGELAMPGGVDAESGARRQQPRLAARFVIPTVPCQTMLEAIPRELAPYLDGFELRGKFHTDLKVAIDWSDLQQTALDGSVGLLACKVREAPEETGVERLKESFVHYVEVERDKWLDFVVGPENIDFVSIWDVSPHLLNSLMTTEDSRFYKHDGFIIREFRTALIKNLEAGYFRYGASSITMQTVKNVLLYREKTLSRKLQELFLTWHIEQELDKDRIFEIYINAIEFGPGLYGIGPAARHFFGKHPRDLNPVESAYFSSILPSPKRRYRQYCDNELWRWTKKKVGRILKLMHKRGLLTDDEYEVAQVTPLVFDRTEAGTETARECKRRVRRAIKNARPTNPLKK